jgi:hypothetical protein
MSTTFEPIIRWTPKRKAEIVGILARGERTLQEICDGYGIGWAELLGWIEAHKRDGVAGLKVTGRGQDQAR